MSPAAPGSELTFIDVRKSFPNSGDVLQNINLSIRPGEFVVVLGASGSGKSTLLRLMAGLEAADGGQISHSMAEKYKRAFVFQESQLLSWRTVEENVALPLELMGKNPQDVAASVAASLERVGLGDAGQLFPRELSGGMKMRTSLARALVCSPGLLLLDEPFAALDEDTRFKLGEDLRQLWQKHKMTVVFVTHSTQEACYLAERIILLEGKPARIAHDLRLDLPIERNFELRTSAAFNAQLRRIHQLQGRST